MQKIEMQKKNRIVIWPVYLDLGRTREQGRLVPVDVAVKSPKVSEIVRAAERLGLNPEVEHDKAHPSAWWDKSGLVTVDSKGTKTDILRRIGAEILRMRGGKSR